MQTFNAAVTPTFAGPTETTLNRRPVPLQVGDRVVTRAVVDEDLVVEIALRQNRRQRQLEQVTSIEVEHGSADTGHLGLGTLESGPAIADATLRHVLISFLLPTRDRLPYLKLAIETVRRQDNEDWEIVVADNASEEDVVAYVNSLEDSRILVRRAPEPVPVTENWNAALEMSSGDYVLMLGDDDGLLPGVCEPHEPADPPVRSADFSTPGR